MKKIIVNIDNILAFASGELLAFTSAGMSGVFEFGLLGLKTFFIAILGGLGGMIGKWIWNKLMKQWQGLSNYIELLKML